MSRTFATIFEDEAVEMKRGIKLKRRLQAVVFAGIGFVSAVGLAHQTEPLTSSAERQSASDLAKKAEIMNGPRWRRALFELGQWLGAQQIYTPAQVAQIKSEFNDRVQAMSSFELEYLLDDLDAKFKVMETPEAMEARAWVGQYLSVLSDRKRAAALKDVPDVTKMTAGELQAEILKIEAMRQSLTSQQQGFDQTRQQIAQARQQSIQATQAAAAAPLPGGGASYSPYRGGSPTGGQPPFSNVKGSGMSVGVGPFGAYMNMSVSQF